MRFRLLSLFVLLVIAFGVWAVWIADDGRGWLTRRPEPPDHARLLAKLAEPASVSADAVPLPDLLAQLATQHGVEIRIDEDGLTNFCVPKTVPVTVQVEGVSFYSAVRIVLSKASKWMRVVVDGETLVVTESHLSLNDPRFYVGRVYPLSSLLLGPGQASAHDLAELIKDTISPLSWIDAGGSAEIEVLPGGVAVAHTLDVHVQIEALLAQLQHLAKGPGDASPVELVSSMNPGQTRALAALDRRISTDFVDLPFGDVCTKLSQTLGVPVLLDTANIHGELDLLIRKGQLPPADVAKLLQLQTISDLKVTLVAEEQCLEDILCWPPDVRLPPLVAKVHDEAIWLTMGSTPCDDQFVRIYPVTDLLPSVVGRSEDDCAQLVDLIREHIATGSWQVDGGLGVARPFGDVVVVLRQQEVHRKVERLIGGLRAALDPMRTGSAGPPSPETSRVEAALAERASISGDQFSLADLAAYVRRQHGIDVYIDRPTLDEAGMPTDVTVRAADIPLEQVLRRALAQCDLAFTVDGRGIQITTFGAADANREIRWYHVRHLVDPDVGIADAQQLVALLKQTCGSWAWTDLGGCGTISLFNGILVVAHRRGIQQEVAAVLDALEHYQRRPKSVATIRVTPTAHAGADLLEEALQQNLDVKYDGIPVGVAAADLAQRLGIPVFCVASVRDRLVTADARGVTLATALDLMLRDVDLSFVPWCGEILIADPWISDNKTLSRIYPVRDLLYHPEPGPDPPIGPDFSAPDLGHTAWAPVDYDSLSEIVTDTLHPDRWGNWGDPGVVGDCEGALVIDQTWRMHGRIERLLAEMRHALWPQRHPDPGRPRVEQVLDTTTDLNFDGVLLEGLLADVGQQHDIKVGVPPWEPYVQIPVGACPLVSWPFELRLEVDSYQDDPFGDGYPTDLTLDAALRWLQKVWHDYASRRVAEPAKGEGTPYSDMFGSLHPLDGWALNSVAWVVHRWRLELRRDEPRIHCRFVDMPLGQALTELLAPYGRVVCSDGAAVRVHAADDSRRPMITRVYDVRKLAPAVASKPTGRYRGPGPFYTSPVPVVGGSGIMPPAGGGEFPPWEGPVGTRPGLLDFLGFAGCVMQQVRPETWIDGGGYGSAKLFKGLLVVRQDWHVHQELAPVLAQLSATAEDLPLVDRLTRNGDPADVERWIEAIATTQDGRFAAYAAFVLRDTDKGVEAASKLIDGFRETTPETDPALHDALCELIGSCGSDAKEAVPLLAERLEKYPHVDRRMAMIAALGQIGEPAGPALAKYFAVRATQAMTVVEWWSLLAALAGAGPSAGDAVEPLLRRLVDADGDWPPLGVANALLAMDPDAKRCRQVLDRWNSAADEKTRARGRRMSGRIGSILGDSD